MARSAPSPTTRVSSVSMSRGDGPETRLPAGSKLEVWQGHPKPRFALLDAAAEVRAGDREGPNFVPVAQEPHRAEVLPGVFGPGVGDLGDDRHALGLAVLEIGEAGDANPAPFDVRGRKDRRHRQPRRRYRGAADEYGRSADHDGLESPASVLVARLCH